MFTLANDNSVKMRRLFLLVCVAVAVQCQKSVARNPWRDHNIEIGCTTAEESKNIDEPDCGVATIKVKYCVGYCPSATQYKHVYPFYESKCTCCKAKKMRTKMHSIKCDVKSDGKERTKVVPVDEVAECGCRACTRKKRRSI